MKQHAVAPGVSALRNGAWSRTRLGQLHFFILFSFCFVRQRQACAPRVCTLSLVTDVLCWFRTNELEEKELTAWRRSQEPERERESKPRCKTVHPVFFFFFSPVGVSRNAAMRSLRADEKGRACRLGIRGGPSPEPCDRVADPPPTSHARILFSASWPTLHYWSVSVACVPAEDPPFLGRAQARGGKREGRAGTSSVGLCRYRAILLYSFPSAPETNPGANTSVRDSVCTCASRPWGLLLALLALLVTGTNMTLSRPGLA